MKTFTLLLVLMLAVAGSAYAQSTTATTAADGTYPAGTAFNLVPITGIDIGSGVIIGTDGTAEGHIALALAGPINPLTGKQQTIIVEAEASGGSRPAGNVATLTGTCTVDMGDGTLPLVGVPFAATITTDSNSQGTVGIVIGATALPAATITSGSMTITAIAD